MRSNWKRGPSAAMTATLAGMLFLLIFSAACKTSKNNTGAAASVNGQQIMRSELEKYYTNQVGDTPQKPTDEQADTLRLNILRQMIDNEILMQRAQKLGLIATDDEINAKLAEAKASYTQEEFENQLKRRGLTIEDVKRDLKQQITIQKTLNKEILSKIDITDADITAFYNQHKAEFNLVEPQYRLAQILVTTQPSPQGNIPDKAQNEQDARRKIQIIYNRLESGEDFGTAAMKYSEQSETAQSGGDLGFVPESSLKGDKQAFDLINKLKPGMYTPVITVVDPNSRQVAAFRIIRLLGKEPAGQRDLKDPRVQQAIREQLRDRKEQLLKAAYYEVIHDEAKVENFFAEEILKRAGTGK